MKDGYRPTSFCNDIYPQVKLAYDSFESTFPGKKKFDPSKLERSFNVACISGVVYTVMKRVSDSLYQDTPHLGINIDPLYTGDITMDLRQHRYDFCISHSPIINPAIECLELKEEEMVVAFDRHHPRLKDRITLDEFLSENHVLHSMWNSDDSPLGTASTLAHKRKVVRKAPGAFEMLNTIQGTDMICITPLSVLETVNGTNNYLFAPLPFESSLGRNYLLWHKSRNNDAAHTWFRNKIVQLAEKKPQWGFNS